MKDLSEIIITMTIGLCFSFLVFTIGSCDVKVTKMKHAHEEKKLRYQYKARKLQMENSFCTEKK